MFTEGALIESKNLKGLEVIRTPQEFTLAEDEQVVQSRRTGQRFIVRPTAVGFPRSIDFVRVAIFEVETAVETVVGRPSVIGRRGRLVTANGRIHRSYAIPNGR